MAPCVERRIDVSGAEPVQVAVCICTYKRPLVLAGLLARISDIAREVSDRVRTTMIIVDDDPEQSAHDVARSHDHRFPGGLVYDSTGAGDLAVARNRALDLGIEHGQLLILIDDDCLPDDGWIRAFVDVQERYGADCVAGACDTLWPAETPAWLRDEPFMDVKVDLPDGSVVAAGYTKNVLLSAAYLRRSGLRFDGKFGQIGGEDAMFFYALADASVDVRFAARAVVHEVIPPGRTTLRYQLRRRFWYGNSEAVTSIASGRATRFRMAGSGMKRVAVGVTWPMRQRHVDGSTQWRFAIAEVLRGLGCVLGATGMTLSHR